MLARWTPYSIILKGFRRVWIVWAAHRVKAEVGNLFLYEGHKGDKSDSCISILVLNLNEHKPTEI